MKLVTDQVKWQVQDEVRWQIEARFIDQFRWSVWRSRMQVMDPVRWEVMGYLNEAGR